MSHSRYRRMIIVSSGYEKFGSSISSNTLRGIKWTIRKGEFQGFSSPMATSSSLIIDIWKK